MQRKQLFICLRTQKTRVFLAIRPAISINQFKYISGTEEPKLSPQEIAKLETYLQGKFDNSNIKLMQRPKAKDSVEMMIGDEFIGVAYRDEDEGEVSYSLSICILEEDL